jgi:hypothetical protein
MIANRFHHVFMRNTLRFGRTVVALLSAEAVSCPVEA